MGAYVIRVTSKRVMCTDGKEANLAIFAYKPYGGMWSGKANSKMHFQTGCVTADRLASQGRFSGRVVNAYKEANGTFTYSKDAPVYEYGGGHFVDDALDYSHKPLENVHPCTASG